MNHQALSSFIWSVADLLRGDYKQSEYGKVVLPFTVLRRLDCVLAATKAAVLAEFDAKTKAGISPDAFLLRKAGQVLDQVSAAPLTAESAARASIAVAEAKVLTTEISLQASEKLFELAGSRATLAEFNLDRHWRNARVHTLHDPVRWKYHAVGSYHLNGTLPARHSWI